MHNFTTHIMCAFVLHYNNSPINIPMIFASISSNIDVADRTSLMISEPSICTFHMEFMLKYDGIVKMLLLMI